MLDLYRKGSGLTPRKLWVLLHYSSADSWVVRALAEAEEAAQVPTVDKIRERAAHYARGGGNG